MGWTAVENNWIRSFETVILQEYVDAINERMAVIGQPALGDLADGMDAASAPDLWGAWQNKLTLNAPMFLASNYFDGSHGFTFFTAETWLAAASIPNGFRRISTSKTCLVSGVYDDEAGTTTMTATGGEPFKAAHVGCKLSVLSPTWPGDYTIAGFTSSTVITITGRCPCADNRFSIMPADWTDYDDPAFEYGLAQEGDVIGPWLLADLQAAINALKNTLVESADWFYPEEENNARSGDGEDADRDTAIAEAQATYGVGPYQQAPPGIPMAKSRVGYGGTYLAEYVRCRAWFRWLKPAAEINCDADYYAKALDSYGGTTRWLSHGDFGPVGTAGHLRRWLQEPGLSGAGDKESSVEFGVDVCPWFSATNAYWYGYADVEGAVLCKWNVAGGFEYV